MGEVVQFPKAPSVEELRNEIKRLIGRDVEITTTAGGGFICKYIDYNMSPTSIVGATEAAALAKLLEYLRSKHTPTDGGFVA